MARLEGNYMGQNSTFSLERYLHEWVNQYSLYFSLNCQIVVKTYTYLVSVTVFWTLRKHFEDVIYPKGDPDAVSISKRDVDLLEPETFINDTLIDFYIK